MSSSTPLSGRHALVTGASGGLGADLARALAARGAGVTLVARREDRLRALQRELADRHGVAVEVAVLGLTAEGAAQAVRLLPRRAAAALAYRAMR